MQTGSLERPRAGMLYAYCDRKCALAFAMALKVVGIGPHEWSQPGTLFRLWKSAICWAFRKSSRGATFTRATQPYVTCLCLVPLSAVYFLESLEYNVDIGHTTRNRSLFRRKIGSNHRFLLIKPASQSGENFGLKVVPPPKRVSCRRVFFGS